MNEQSDMRDKQWGELLTRAYGESVEAAPAFRAGLLQSLKAKAAENRAAAGAEEEAEDRNWSRLLTATYAPCEPRAEFKSSLLASLKAKQAEAPRAEQASDASSREDEIMRNLLTTSYIPVEPRRDFETRLLENLKERQRHTVALRKSSRRRTLIFSGFSSLAAAAMVMFVVWVMPANGLLSPGGSSQQRFIQAADLAAPISENVQALVASAPLAETVAEAVQPEAAGIPVFPGAGSYRVADAYASKPLPETVRGIGMEMDSGDGWQPMDSTLIASVEPGMSFRPVSGYNQPGLGFGDGTTVHLLPNTVLNVTDKGLRLHEGFMSVKVPGDADSRFRLDFPEREVAIEPGTMLLASAESPDRYAEGGAPAPLVIVDNGGLALAKGRNGSGVLLANQVYQIDNYVTPALPSRPLCAVECAAMEERMAPIGVALASAARGGLSGAQMISAVSDGSLLPRGPEGFKKQGSRWVASDYEGQPTIKIAYLSDDYFGFANQRRDLANALSLGAEVILNGGDGNFYEICK